jgi:hypothetical protein
MTAAVAAVAPPVKAARAGPVEVFPLAAAAAALALLEVQALEQRAGQVAQV